MVSKEAEERRLRFLAAKEAAGGSFASLIKQELAKKPKVYFLEDGTIVSISKEDLDSVPAGWLCREFDNEQLRILEDKNWNLFYVKKDLLVDNLYSIESRPLESTVVSTENNSLTLIEYNTDYDCHCRLASDLFTVELSDRVLKTYEDIDPVTASANGHKVLKFYFTAKNDPHIMLHSEYISLRQLLINKSVSIKISNIPTECSIYTVKAFSSYSRS